MLSSEKEPFIFVSYAHLDSGVAVPIIDGLKENGFRIWYDNGIEPGSEWPEYIAQKIIDCSVMLVLLSNNSLNSKNCKREINFGIDESKELLVVHLEETKMTPGMKMQLNSNQAVYMYKFRDMQSFLSALYKADILENCRKPSSDPDESNSLSAIEEKAPIIEEDKQKMNQKNESETSKTDVYEKEIIMPVCDTKKENDIRQTTSDDIPVHTLQSEKELFVLREEFYLLLNQLLKQKRYEEARQASSANAAHHPKYTKKPTDYSREIILSAVDCANKHSAETGLKFKTLFSITQFNRAKAYFAQDVRFDDVIAILDTTQTQCGTAGIIVTQNAIYSSYLHDNKRLYLSEIKTLELTADKKRIKITMKNGRTKEIFFDIYAGQLFALLDYILFQKPVLSINKPSDKLQHSNDSVFYSTKKILSAVEYSNKNKVGHFKDFKINFSEKQIANAKMSFAKSISKNDVVAFLDDTFLDSGKKGIVVTKDAMYSSYFPAGVKLTFSEIKSVELTRSGYYVKVTSIYGRTQEIHFSAYAKQVYDLLDYIINK